MEITSLRVRCVLFYELLTDWDHYDVYRFGSIRAFSPQHTLVDVLPDRNRDRLFRQFASTKGGGGEGGQCCAG